MSAGYLPLSGILLHSLLAVVDFGVFGLRQIIHYIHYVM